MEDLTKQQLVLLALLLSFVTSIGTGIITTALLREAPETVTQTINRVVEKTIETVTPKETTIREKETQVQVVVEKDETVNKAIENIKKSIVSVYSVDVENRKLYSKALIVDEVGSIAIPSVGYNPEFKYIAVYPDGIEYTVRPHGTYLTTDKITFLAPEISEDDTVTFTPSTFVSNTDLGQSVIAVGGEVDITLSFGRITSLPKGTVDIPATSIVTDTNSSVLGAVLINWAGSVVGLNTDIKIPRIYTDAPSLVPAIEKVAEETPEDTTTTP